MAEIKDKNNKSNTQGAPMGNKSSAVPTQMPEISHETWLKLNDSMSTERNMDRVASKDTHQDHARSGSNGKRSKIKFVINGILLVIVTLIILTVELGYLPHTKQPFVCQDPKLSFKYRGDTIRPSVLGIVCVFMPLSTFILVEYLRNGNDWKKVSLLVWRWSKLVFIGSIVITLFITEVLKSVFGELRPHFFDTCTPDAAQSCTPGELVENYRCTNTEYSFMVVTDSSRSFPSGHSSLSVFTSFYCAAYIYYRFNSTVYGSLLKPFLISVVMLWGFACGLTRITDHRHHWWDVLAGSTLGAVCALFTVYAFAFKFRNKKRPTSVSSANLWDNKSNNEDESV